MVLVACTKQGESQESVTDSPDSATNAEIYILPPHSLYTMSADFDMLQFAIQENMDSLTAMLKQERSENNAIFSSTLPPVPTWMDETRANDSLYRSAYLKYVKRFVEEFNRRGLTLTTLYVKKDSRESQFTSLEELSTSVKCQFKLTDNLPDTPHQSWTLIKNNE